MFVLTKYLRMEALTLALAAGLLGLQAIVSPGATLAQEKKCECKFAQPPWEAFGTKALCTAWSRKGQTSCEVEFGGLSADAKAVEKILGTDPGAYRRATIDTVRSYLDYLRDGKRDALTEPKFLTSALSTLMRGAYLRGSMDGDTVEQIRGFDSSMTEFLDKFQQPISDVFRGEKPAFSVGFGRAKIEVGRGYIVVDHPVGLLITKYIATE